MDGARIVIQLACVYICITYMYIYALPTERKSVHRRSLRAESNPDCRGSAIYSNMNPLRIFADIAVNGKIHIFGVQR